MVSRKDKNYILQRIIQLDFPKGQNIQGIAIDDWFDPERENQITDFPVIAEIHLNFLTVFHFMSL